VGTIRQRSVLDRFWHAILDRSFGDVPRPADAPFAHSTGSDPLRVLIFGSGTAVGWGLRSHELALPGQLARELGERTARGVDVDLIADRCMTALSAVDAIEGRLIAPYDAVVVSLGMTDSLRLLSPRTFRARMRRVLGELSLRTSPETRIVVLGMQPVCSIPFLQHGGRILDRHVLRLDRVLREVSDECPKGSYVGMSRVPDSHPGHTASAQHYRHWAAEIGDHLAPMLVASHRIRLTQASLDEAARQQAVRELGDIPAARDGRLDRIVELARSVFHAEIATVTIMDGDRQLMLAAAGMDPVEMPRQQSIGEYTIASRTGFVVGDTTADRRFRHMYATSIGLRFYAGYPLHSPSGHPVGSIAVLSSDPRDETTVDLELLGDMAMLVQREMWVPDAVSA
jgi:hypothetical protein